MSTPPVQEITPPKEVEEPNPLQLEGMTPQQVVEWIRQRDEEIRQLREENRQLREVIGRGVFTPRMDEQPSRPMEEMDIGTTPEAMPKTLNNLRSLLLFVREVSILTFCLVAYFLPEAKAFRKISTDWSYILVLFFGCLTVNRVFGVFASFLRKDPAKEFLWSIFNLLVSAPVHYVAYDHLSRQENPPIFECLLLSIFTIASGISPDTAEFVNYRILRMLRDWSLSCIAGLFTKLAGLFTKWAEKFIRWARN